MTRQEAIERMTISLTDAIDKWCNTASETHEWEQIGWFPEDGARLMARAAMTAMEFGASAQDLMRENGVDTEAAA